MSAIGAVLHGGRVGSADLELLRDKLFYDRRDQRDALVRFGVLLVLSTVIAAGGVVGDSTATVIGAMIIAPLMTPIMATALSIVTGDAAHLFRSMIVVVVGACASVGLSFCIGLLSVGIDVSSNSQILSRTNPRIIDLVDRTRDRGRRRVRAGARGCFGHPSRSGDRHLTGATPGGRGDLT